MGAKGPEKEGEKRTNHRKLFLRTTRGNQGKKMNYKPTGGHPLGEGGGGFQGKETKKKKGEKKSSLSKGLACGGRPLKEKRVGKVLVTGALWRKKSIMSVRDHFIV